MGNPFPRSRRLQRRRDVQRVFDEGDFFEGHLLHMIRGTRDEDPTRAAFVVSQKTARRAVDRNRIKRLMRESFRQTTDRIEEGWPLVFLATRRARADLKRIDFDREMEALLEKANLYENAD